MAQKVAVGDRALTTAMSAAYPRAMARTALVAITFTFAAACSKSPAEPDAPARSTTEVATVAALEWDVPPTWSVTPPQKTGPKKAHYDTQKAGDAKAGAEVEVFFFGTGALGDADKNFKTWFDQFDGDVGSTAARESFDAKGGSVATVEVKGTYKIDLGPKVGPADKKKAAMQMVRENYRLVGAVVKTKDKGNWFFKMVGPDESVSAAKSQFRGMLESAR